MMISNPDFYHDDPVDSKVPAAKKKLPSVLALLLLVVGGSFFIQTTLSSNVTVAVVSNAAWAQVFDTGNQYDFTPKGNSYWVRPIRAF
jgi:hypothetical protein